MVGRSIYVIGGLGYAGERRYGATQVYRLDINTLAFEPVETSGECPGWIFSHKAVLAGDMILISGGKICRHDGEKEVTNENERVFALDLKVMRWSMR